MLEREFVNCQLNFSSGLTPIRCNKNFLLGFTAVCGRKGDLGTGVVILVEAHFPSASLLSILLAEIAF